MLAHGRGQYFRARRTVTSFIVVFTSIILFSHNGYAITYGVTVAEWIARVEEFRLRAFDEVPDDNLPLFVDVSHFDGSMLFSDWRNRSPQESATWGLALANSIVTIVPVEEGLAASGFYNPFTDIMIVAEWRFEPQSSPRVVRLFLSTGENIRGDNQESPSPYWLRAGLSSIAIITQRTVNNFVERWRYLRNQSFQSGVQVATQRAYSAAVNVMRASDDERFMTNDIIGCVRTIGEQSCPGRVGETALGMSRSARPVGLQQWGNEAIPAGSYTGAGKQYVVLASPRLPMTAVIAEYAAARGEIRLLGWRFVAVVAQ